MESRAVLLSSLVGVLFIILLLYLDKYEREPRLKIGLLFASSILATGLYGGIASRIFDDDGVWTLGLLCVRTPLLEEGTKFGLFLLVYRIWRRWIDEPFDLVVYLGIIALGFSVQENIGYYVMCTRRALLSGWLTGDYSWYDRALTAIAVRRAVPGHLMMDTVGAWVLARGFGTRSFPLWFLAAYATAAAVHAGWNLFASIGGVAFILYLMPLTVATALIVERMRQGSRYLRSQRECQAGVAEAIEGLERTVAAVGTVPPELRPLLETAERGLGRILLGLRGLTSHPGTDQARVFRMLEQAPPIAPSRLDRRSLEELNGRLEPVSRILGTYGREFFHWTYWLCLLAIFASVGVAATILSLFVERAIARF